MFVASDVALQFVASVRSVVEAVARCDANLADQLRRAVTSAALNTAEAGRREGRDRGHRARIAGAECAEAIAAAEAQEVKAALRVAVAWGYVAPPALADALGFADRLQAILWRLGHPRR